MKIKHRYTFRDDNNMIKEVLDLYHIKYNISSGIPLISVEVFEDAEYWVKLDNLMTKYGASSLVSKEFKKNEILNADWLTIRGNWRLGYPQPDNGFEYRKTTYNNGNYCYKCGCGLEQKESFRFKKQINWANKNFLMLYWIEDELFLSNKVAEEFQKHSVSGVTFLPVKSIRTDEELDNIKQMKVDTILKKGLVFNDSDIEEKTNCEKCNETKYVLNGRKQLSLKKEIFENCPDVVKSFEVFGTGMIAARQIIISKKVASIILKNGWDKNVVLEPITLE